MNVSHSPLLACNKRSMPLRDENSVITGAMHSIDFYHVPHISSRVLSMTLCEEKYSILFISGFTSECKSFPPFPPIPSFIGEILLVLLLIIRHIMLVLIEEQLNC